MKQGWEKLPFEDSIVKVKYTTKIPSNDYLEQGLYPIVSQEEGLISGYWDNANDVFKISSPVVIFGDHTRILKYVDFDFVLGADGVKILQPIKSIDAKFFKLYLESCKIPSLGYSRHYKLLKELQVPIPPIEEQEKIVEELDCLSGVIERKREQLKQLDTLAQSIFYQMFGDPITNEKGWEVKKLEELCDIINGFAFPSSDFAECNPIKVIKITNVGVNEFISDDSSLPEEYNNMEGCKVHTGDIVIALTRTIISTGVKRAIVPNEYNESLVNQRVAAILANDRIVSRRFIYSFLGTDFVRQYILQKATALMQPNLSIRDLRDMPTIYPPLALQQEFADKIEAIEKQKELIKQSITQTEELFNSRMDYYFN